MIFLNELRANEKLANLAAPPAPPAPLSDPSNPAAPRLPLPVFRARTH